MSQNEFMGLLIACLAVLISMVISILNYVDNHSKKNKKEDADRDNKFQTQLDKLEESINALNIAVNTLNETVRNMRDDLRENQHNEKALEDKVNNHEVRITTLENKDNGRE